MVFIGQINHHTKSWEIKGYHLKMKFVSSNKQVWPLQPPSLCLKKKRRNTTQGQQSVIPSVMRCRPVSVTNIGWNKYTLCIPAFNHGAAKHFPTAPQTALHVKIMGHNSSLYFLKYKLNYISEWHGVFSQCIAIISLVMKGPFGKWTKLTYNDKTKQKQEHCRQRNTLPKVNNLANLH